MSKEPQKQDLGGGPAAAAKRGYDLCVVGVDAVAPCPYQPRLNISVDHVRRLADSFTAGRHDPLIVVEPHPIEADRYQIVYGEQRWRAAVEAGRTEILVQVRPPLGYLERLELQLEENRLRKDLDPIEEAWAILLNRDLRAVARGEQLLVEAGISFTALDHKVIRRREEFSDHLSGVLSLLDEHRLRRPGAGVSGLAPWRETERALGLSETARKVRLGLLRLEPDVLESVRHLPLEHAAQLSRLSDPALQREAAAQAPDLNCTQMRQLVEASLSLGAADRPEAAPDPLAFTAQLSRAADLCRQLLRLLCNLLPRISEHERAQLWDVLSEVTRQIDSLDTE